MIYYKFSAPGSYDIDSTKIPMQDYGDGSTCDNDWFPKFPYSDWKRESCDGWTPTLKGISEGIRLLNVSLTKITPQGFSQSSLKIFISRGYVIGWNCNRIEYICYQNEQFIV